MQRYLSTSTASSLIIRVVVAVAMLAPVLVQPMPIRRNMGEQAPQHGRTGPTTWANKPNSMLYHGNLVDDGVATVLTFNSVINAAISACSRGATPRPLPDVPSQDTVLDEET